MLTGDYLIISHVDIMMVQILKVRMVSIAGLLLPVIKRY